MTIDKRIEQLISHGGNCITISKEEYQNLNPETKNLIKLNDIKVIYQDQI